MSDFLYPNVMLDLETMGNGPNAAITAIGACVFDVPNSAFDDTFYTVVNLQSSVEAGGIMDASTVLWWLKQDEFARKEFERKGKPMARALQSFADWLEDLGDRKTVRIWGNGAAFDNTILAAAYRRLSIPQPWEYWNDRCYRTVKSMFPTVKIERAGTHHNALDDAIHQARHMFAVYNAGKQVEK